MQGIAHDELQTNLDLEKKCILHSEPCSSCQALQFTKSVPGQETAMLNIIRQDLEQVELGNGKFKVKYNVRFRDRDKILTNCKPEWSNVKGAFTSTN